MIELVVSDEMAALRRQDAAYRMRAGWSRVGDASHAERVLMLEAIPPGSTDVVCSVVQVHPARPVQARVPERRSHLVVLSSPTDQDPPEWWLIHADVVRRAALRARAMDREEGIHPRRLQVPSHGGAVGAGQVREAIDALRPAESATDPVDRGARDVLTELANAVLPRGA